MSGCVPCIVHIWQVYRLYSELISQAIATGGQHAAKTTFVKYMRSVKKVALKVSCLKHHDMHS